jgi:hypothetical protein
LLFGGDISRPVEILSPVEIPGWGQIGYGYIEDAVTWGNYALETGGAAYALKYHEAELQRLVDMKIWRSPAAYDLLTKLRSMVLAEQTEALAVQMSEQMRVEA